MRILHTGTLDVNVGGPAMSTYNLLSGLQNLGEQAEILMYQTEGKLIAKNVKIHFAKPPLEQKFAYSASLKKELTNLGIFDIYHAQGVWQYPTYVLAAFARKNKRPYLISPRGMLYPQDIAKASTFFKKMSLKLKLLSDLNRASCVHATCNEEMKYLRDLGVTSPIAVIPNPIHIHQEYTTKKDTLFRLGYLGRLSPRKNVESLLYAWKTLGNQTSNAELLIIGGGDNVYEDFLKKETEKLELQNVRFTGFLSGKDKEEAIASLSVLAMPSEFENFGNVILEGLIRKIPCIATKGAPWQELETENCGWWVDYNQEAITQAVYNAINLSAKDLDTMGENGKNLVIERYSVEAVSKDMKAVYQSLISNEVMPSFVYLK